MSKETIINEKLGAWLIQEGHTRELLASEIGITRPTLKSRLDGTTPWVWDEVKRISLITGASLDELAGLKAAS